MRPSVASAFGRLMSIGSSATKTRPSGAQATTEGCLIFGASAKSSSRQSARGFGRAEAAKADSVLKETKRTKTANKTTILTTSRTDRSRFVPVMIILGTFGCRKIPGLDCISHFGDTTLGGDGFSLSLRERAGVRGKLTLAARTASALTGGPTIARRA